MHTQEKSYAKDFYYKRVNFELSDTTRCRSVEGGVRVTTLCADRFLRRRGSGYLEVFAPAW
jgi:hypothetical protein